MRGRVEDDEQTVLHAQQLVDRRGERFVIKIVLRVEQLKIRDGTAEFLTDHAVSAPEPIGGQHLVALFHIVRDRETQCPRAAGGCNRAEVSVRTIAGKGDVDDRIEICGQSCDRGVGDIILDGEGAEDALHGRQMRQFPRVVHDGADRGVRHAILAILFTRGTTCRARAENRVL